MIIKVTQKHINEGVKRSACECPLALAIGEATGRRVTVSEDHFRFCGTPDGEGAESIYRQLPVKAVRFYQNFDFGETVRQFSFEVKL